MIEDRDGWDGWTSDALQDRIAAARGLQSVLGTTGVPAEHPFWSSTKTALVPRDRDRLGHLYETIEEHLGSCRQSLRTLSELLHLEEPERLRDGRRLVAGAERAAQMPDLRGVAVEDPAWSSEIDRLDRVLEQGRQYRSLHDDFDPQLLPEAWTRDVLALRSALVQFGERWWRFLAPDYRKAIRELRALSASKLPKAFEDRLSLVEGIRQSQQLEGAFEEETPLFGKLFGERWRSGGSDWPALGEASTWLRRAHADVTAGELPADFLAVTGAGAAAEDIRAARSRAEGELTRLTELLSELEDLARAAPGNRMASPGRRPRPGVRRPRPAARDLAEEARHPPRHRPVQPFRRRAAGRGALRAGRPRRPLDRRRRAPRRSPGLRVAQRADRTGVDRAAGARPLRRAEPRRGGARVPTAGPPARPGQPRPGRVRPLGSAPGAERVREARRPAPRDGKAAATQADPQAYGRSRRCDPPDQAGVHDEPALGRQLPAAGRPDLRPRDLRRGQPGAAGRRVRGDPPGRQAVVVGDSKQLPPTPFFESSSTTRTRTSRGPSRGTWRASWGCSRPRASRTACSAGTTAAGTTR